MPIWTMFVARIDNKTGFEVVTVEPTVNISLTRNILSRMRGHYEDWC
jgi:hypothetical protein